MPKQAGFNERGAYISSPMMRGGAATFGPLSIVPEDATEDELAHESRHRDQFAVPGWSLLKVLDAMHRVTGRPEGEIPLERDAYRSVQPSHEMVRQPAPVADVVGGYLRALLGK